jgi:hypothetical protein
MNRQKTEHLCNRKEREEREEKQKIFGLNQKDSAFFSSLRPLRLERAKRAGG